MKKSRGIVVLLLTVILTVFFCFTAAVGIGPTGTGAAKHINTGLDLSGGVSITYQTKKSDPTKEEMSDTIYKLQKRVEQYSTEAQVYQEGSDRITVEIPGVTDADAILNDLGKPGSLYFITQEDADGNQNFTTGQNGYVLARSMDEIKESGSVVLEGSDVADAEGGAIQNQSTSAKEYVVSLTLTSDGENSGKEKFSEATKENVGKQIAIIYDNQVVSAPNVNEQISGGKAQISGMKDLEEAQNLASYIRIGSLSLELEELRSSVVAAQLGEEAISTSVMAGAIGLIIVIVFMIIAYRVPGIVAGIALILYTVLMLITLNAFDITLTLPGIAGIILGIGMAVDANVIIYARIREEIGAGVSVRSAIKAGFSKAFSAIFDGNITTLIAAFVLMWLGSGTVKGFAYTLALGIVISMFTSLVVSRLIEGEYFKIDQMLSSDYETKVRINKKEFLSCIDRATLLVKEGDKKPVIINITDGSMKLKMNSTVGSMDEEIDIAKEGKDLMIGFNPKFLIDALRVIDDEEVDLYMVNPKAPCFIRNAEESYIYLVLPVNFTTVS